MPNENIKYYETAIVTDLREEGMWKQQEAGGQGWEKEFELEQELRNKYEEVFELGKDTLPLQIQDIRGNIYGQEGRIFVAKPFGQQTYNYFAIVERAQKQQATAYSGHIKFTS